MKALRDRTALIVAVISLAVSGFLLWKRSGPLLSGENANAGSSPAASREVIAEMNQNLQLLSADLENLKRAVGDAVPVETLPGESDGSGGEGEGETEGGAEPPRFASIDQRIRTLEDSLSRLQSNYDGISIEASSAERAEIFASDEGAIKADEYFEAGKYSIAAEGYLTYYRNHPEDPDGRAILDRARSAYARSGYADMSIWVQEEKMRIFPEYRAEDLKSLATMQKNAGNYDAAVNSAAESAELTENSQERLWTRMYWAWYNELRDGASGGLDAYRQVQREIEDAGYTDHRLNERAQEKIDEIQKRIAAEGR